MKRGEVVGLELRPVGEMESSGKAGGFPLEMEKTLFAGGLAVGVT